MKIPQILEKMRRKKLHIYERLLFIYSLLYFPSHLGIYSSGCILMKGKYHLTTKIKRKK